MAKPYTRVSSIHESKPDRRGDRDVRVTTQPVRLTRQPQAKSGPKHPN